jgi:hypothetical protein
LLDNSPDVKRFDKKKRLIMEYMKRAMTNQMGGFHIEPKMMGSESGISNRKGSVGG